MGSLELTNDQLYMILLLNMQICEIIVALVILVASASIDRVQISFL